MKDYDPKILETMTVKRYLDMCHGDERSSESAYEAKSCIELYIYSNLKCVDDFEIGDSEFEDDHFIISFRCDIDDKDVPIIQKDVDDFITHDVDLSLDDTIEIDVDPDMTFINVAEKTVAEIEESVKMEIEYAVEKLAEIYRDR